MFFPTENGCFRGHFSRKGREASLGQLLQLCLCGLQRKHGSVLIPRETMLVDQRERAPDCCCFVSLQKQKQPSGGLPWWSSGWDSELPIQGAQVPFLIRKLDPHTANNPNATKRSHSPNKRLCVPQLRLGTAKIKINVKKERKRHLERQLIL